MVDTQFACKIKIFRSDNAMECMEKGFFSFLACNETSIQYSYSGTSQLNGHAERKHRHILDFVRVLLISGPCPEYFWGEVVLTIVYNINLNRSLIGHWK